MEEELQKCAAAAFEVSTSLNVAEYEQMLLPVSGAGGTAPMEEAKLNCCASQSQVQQEQGQHRLFQLWDGSQCCSEADSELLGPALHHQGSHVSWTCQHLLCPCQVCPTRGDFICEEAA